MLFSLYHGCLVIIFYSKDYFLSMFLGLHRKIVVIFPLKCFLVAKLYQDLCKILRNMLRPVSPNFIFYVCRVTLHTQMLTHTMEAFMPHMVDSQW
jgi:hypothetical protein